MTTVAPGALERAKAIDAAMEWDNGLAIGRLVTLWIASQPKDKPVIAEAAGALILRWAEVPRDQGERFLAACCQPDAHFLEPLDGGRYRIVGADFAEQRRQNQARKSSAGGKAKAANEKLRKAGVLPEALPQARLRHATSTASGTASGMPEPLPEGVPTHCLEPAVLLLSSKREENLSLSETTTNARARARDADLPEPESDFAGLTPLGLAALWNELRGSLAKAPKQLDDATLELARAALAADGRPDYWRRVFETTASTPFLTGQRATLVSPSGFRARFKFVLENHERIAAGEYADAEAAPPKCHWCADTGVAVRRGEDGEERHFGCPSCKLGRKSGVRQWSPNTDIGDRLEWVRRYEASGKQADTQAGPMDGLRH